MQHDTAPARAIGHAAWRRVLAEHTCAHRAAQLEGYALELLGGSPPLRRPWAAASVTGIAGIPASDTETAT